MKITKIKDYVPKVHEHYPELTEDEVKRILVYGWKLIIQYVSAGNDVSVKDPPFFFFIGKLPKDSLALFHTYCRKLSKRIQYMFKRTNSEWDGYYYFARTEAEYADYLTLNRRKYKIFKNVYLYKLLEEIKIREHSKPYIFRLSEDRTNWMSKYYEEIKTDKAELIIQRDPLNMGDVMTSLNKYKYLQQR